ncbi:MAG: hypothetical protein OEX12_11725 [Gammaproteobacteria bacterium]|nr:hypothetical protein [Gammaproteobacteria bacterium]
MRALLIYIQPHVGHGPTYVVKMVLKGDKNPLSMVVILDSDPAVRVIQRLTEQHWIICRLY